MFHFLTLLVSLINPTVYPPVTQIEVQHEVLEPVPIPHKNIRDRGPVLSLNAQLASMSMDLESGKVLLSQQAHRPQNIASLTKLMTALLILENHDFDETVIVPLEATQAEGAQIELYAQEALSVRTLLEAILIGSANDAAVALAHHHSGSEEAFAKAMNQRAQELGLSSARFYNSTGLDIIQEFEDDRPFELYGNMMSAYDSLQLARILWQYDFVRETVAKDTFEGTSVDGKFFHEKGTTNQLLGNFQGVKGLKTGFTYLAGECFIAVAENEDGQEVMSVILGSTARFDETKKILGWINETYLWP